ncbi:MAG: hypothetical protein A2Z02_02420 [Chloroflexi bacterium RBG_16_48_7]|nr:MAG: hypothetical protein A2Z02_02420 [Chloroflexi bacterium RBG_16_48_7]
MAYIVVETGLGADAYRGIYKWIGHFKGGLATATIGGSTAMAAVTGIGASTIGIGLIAVPEMRKFKYDDGLAAGAIAAGSTLGPMIPPSIGFIIFGILAQESIGKLFIAGIIPGLLLAISFVLVIMIQCGLNPKLGPPGEKSSWNERIRVLPSLAPIILLFLIIIGGIYVGIFSPMEGGAIGAIMTWVIALFLRRVTWKNFKSAILESMKFICMTLIIIGCGMAFGNSLATTGLSMQIVEATKEAGLSPLVFILFIMVIYLIFGIICDAPIILILTTPILAPALKGMGVDLIWFGVLATLVVNVGTITPPYAMSIFMLRSLAMKDVSLGVMFRGVIPFCISSFIVAVLIIIFPAIATWLPELMK